MAVLSDESKSLETKGEREARDKLHQRFSVNKKQPGQQIKPDQNPTDNNQADQQPES